MKSGNVAGFFQCDSRDAQAREEFVIVRAPQRRVRLPRRAEVLFDADMNLHRSTREPNATAFGQEWRLGYLLHPQQLAVETPRGILAARRRSQLNVVNRRKGMVSHTPMLRRIQRADAFCLLESM